ncbi:cell wall integrity and stress response component [Microdochium nivale]|nr:cell wall integrity and stress response component [Microdochium nivale]
MTTSAAFVQCCQLCLDDFPIFTCHVEPGLDLRLCISRAERAMSRLAFHTIFLRLPTPALAVIFATLLASSQAGALPRQTPTVDYLELDAVSWPLTPTPAPLLPLDLLRRQAPNTICGYIEGNSALPATCSAGSHCVLDQGHGYVGCCPDSGPCTAGIFTGCVDVNSPPQTVINPYIYTCQGSDVCYKNEFAGGYNQYGCGTHSDMGKSVQTSIQGLTTALVLPELSASLTQDVSSLSEPTTIGSTASTPNSNSASPSSTSVTSRSSSTTGRPTTDSASTTQSLTSKTSSTSTNSAIGGANTNSSADQSAENSSNRSAVAIGAAVGSVAGVALLCMAVCFFCRRRKNNRDGPGPAPAAPDTRYISPIGNHGAAFAPLPTWSDEDQHHYGQDYPRRSDESQVRLVPPPLHQHPVFNQQPLMGIGTGLTAVVEERHEDNDADHRTRYSREIDNFSPAYSNARMDLVSPQDDLGRQPFAGTAGMNLQGTTGDRGTTRTGYNDAEPIISPLSDSDLPVWQQNRQQSQNTWI